MNDDLISAEKAQALLDGATPGRRVQFHGSYCKEAQGSPFTDWDTSHEMSVILPDGTRYRLAHYRHAADAYLSQMAPDLARAYIEAAAESTRLRAQVDLLARVLENRDGGSHDEDCKARRYAMSDGLCNCGHDETVAALATYQQKREGGE